MDPVGHPDLPQSAQSALRKFGSAPPRPKLAECQASEGWCFASSAVNVGAIAA